MAKAKKKVTAKKEVVSKIEKVKELFKKIVSWVDSKGFSALLSLGLGVGLWIFGYKICAGIAFGVFLTRNWDLFRGWIKK